MCVGWWGEEEWERGGEGRGGVRWTFSSGGGFKNSVCVFHVSLFLFSAAQNVFFFFGPQLLSRFLITLFFSCL